MTLATKLHALTGATQAEAAFIDEAIALLGEAVSDAGFLTTVCEAEYVATRWTPAEGPQRSFTSAQIATRIGEGRERGAVADQTLDLALDLIDLPGPESGKQVLGSTALGVLPVHTARWFVSRCMAASEGRGDPVNFASHLMHEWCHVSGFSHWPDNKARGDTAYVVGRLVRELLAPRHGDRIDPGITALMADTETDCGCRGNAS